MMPAGMVPVQTLRRMKIKIVKKDATGTDGAVRGTCERDAESAVKPDNTLVQIRVPDSANNGLEWHSCS
jgi:hypothetical protein